MEIPNVLEIEWTDKNRIESVSNVMAFSSRDWSVYQNGRGKDKEKWLIWCLMCSDTKTEAIKNWTNFINET